MIKKSYFKKTHSLFKRKDHDVIFLICAGISNQALKKIRKANPKEDLMIVLSLKDNKICRHFGEDKIINDALNSIGEGGDKFHYFEKVQ